MYMLRSIIKGSLLTGAALLLAASAQAQCKAFAKNKCVPELAPYKFNENFNAAQLSPGDEAEVALTFYSGQEYRVAVCVHPILGEVNWKLVDENNKITGQATRGEVHAKALKHRAVHIFVFNKHGELWLQQRSHLKDVSPLKWDSSAAGHLDAGESYADSAVRELNEEIGIAVTETELAAEIPAGDNTDHEFVELRLAQHDGRQRRCGVRH